MRSKTFIIILLLSFFGITLTFSQDEDYSKEPVKTNGSSSTHKILDRMVFGGGAGLQFGSETNISLMPKAGYYFTDNFLAGAGLTYIYYKINFDRIYGYGGTYQTSVYGGSLFGDFFIMDNLFLHAEPEFLNYEMYDYKTGNETRTWVSSYFVGAGYRSKISKKGFVAIMLLYNLNYKENSPYGSPFMPRISFFL